ncbi:MAG: hypothetical protein VX434_04230 [Pseudomonadota bacterium]|nr:hypothetical protein [Pseudomonadota bacterium]
MKAMENRSSVVNEALKNSGEVARFSFAEINLLPGALEEGSRLSSP